MTRPKAKDLPRKRSRSLVQQVVDDLARKIRSGVHKPGERFPTEPVVMADLVLCAPVIAREAAELGKPLGEHYAHLLVHGTLHAQGWDHETSEVDAEEMEARETEILAGLGQPDPYAK